jgi:hypothetical protein
MDMPTPPPPVSTRIARPWTVAGTVGLPGGLGVEVSRQLDDRLALSAHAASWLAVTDLGLGIRFFPLRSERAGLYVGGGVNALIAPVLFPTAAPAMNGELGGEFRARNGFTIGGGIGLMGLYAPKGSEGGGGEFGLVPTAQLRIGHSF